MNGWIGFWDFEILGLGYSNVINSVCFESELIQDYFSVTHTIYLTYLPRRGDANTVFV